MRKENPTKHGISRDFSRFALIFEDQLGNRRSIQLSYAAGRRVRIFS
jgi:hypothetical protein